MDVVEEIEEAFVAQSSKFGRWSQGELHDENGVLWFETPIKRLPYNAVIRTRIDGDADAVVCDGGRAFQGTRRAVLLARSPLGETA